MKRIKGVLLALSCVLSAFVLAACSNSDSSSSDTITWTFRNDCQDVSGYDSLYGYYPLEYITVTPIGSEDDSSFVLEIGESKEVTYPYNAFGFSYTYTYYRDYGGIKGIEYFTEEGYTVNSKNFTQNRAASARATSTVSVTIKKPHVFPEVVEDPPSIIFTAEYY